MRKIAANQLTQEMYGSLVTFCHPVCRGEVRETIRLSHIHVDGEWVLIGAEGAGTWDRYRVKATSIVEVRG